MDSSITPLTGDMILVLGLSAFVMTMFVFERIRGDATALVVLVILGVSDLVPSTQLFQGFSGNAVISIIASMILSSGLERTGALNRLAGWLLRRSDGIEERLILFNSAAAGLISGFMQNPSVTALFAGASRLSARTGIVLSRCSSRWHRNYFGQRSHHDGSSPLIMLNDLLLSATAICLRCRIADSVTDFCAASHWHSAAWRGSGYFFTRGKKWLRDDETKGVMPSPRKAISLNPMA